MSDSNFSSKKILIISYYWPPAGGPGVQRWLKFVKYLPDFGIEPHVYVPKNPTYPLLDEKLVTDVSDKAIIVKKPILNHTDWLEYSQKRRLKKSVRGLFRIKRNNLGLKKC
jgi:hypothetical protein